VSAHSTTRNELRAAQRELATLRVADPLNSRSESAAEEIRKLSQEHQKVQWQKIYKKEKKKKTKRIFLRH
jgi:hypothetical protein